MNLEKKPDLDEDPMEKVRRFLQDQGGMTMIEEGAKDSPRKKNKRRNRQKSAGSTPQPGSFDNRNRSALPSAA